MLKTGISYYFIQDHGWVTCSTFPIAPDILPYEPFHIYPTSDKVELAMEPCSLAAYLFLNSSLLLFFKNLDLWEEK